MEITTINTELVAKMFLAGAKNLDAKKEWINELNVFPVPDGDTGTNMTLTITSAAKEVASLENPEMEPLCKAISSGSLRGARGNSGVILSQLLRGFTKGIKKHDEIDAPLLAEAFEKAVEHRDLDMLMWLTERGKPDDGLLSQTAIAAADGFPEGVVYLQDRLSALGHTKKQSFLDRFEL